jgi:hypothetical protein
MKSRTILIAVVIAAIIGLAAFVYFRPTETVSLVAKGEVSVFATADDSMSSPASKPIAEIAPQQSVRVLQCIDVKHYQIYKVQLPDGQNGYVNVGAYALIGRDGNPTSC